MAARQNGHTRARAHTPKKPSAQGAQQCEAARCSCTTKKRRQRAARGTQLKKRKVPVCARLKVWRQQPIVAKKQQEERGGGATGIIMLQAP
jgi:hypothetical protein